MTIKEFAKSKGISTQAVYQRIKNAGIQLDTIRDAQGLTQDGLQRLDELFATPAQNGSQAQIQALRDALEDMRKQRDHWQRQAEQMAAALEVAQRIADQAQQLNAATIQQRKGFIARLLGK